MKFLTNLNLHQNELQNARIQQLATPPVNPVSGQIYYNTVDNRFYTYDGIKWIDLTVARQGTLDGVTLIGTPVIKSSVAKEAVGSVDVEALRVEDSNGQELFQVKGNGDTIIGGILTVNGTGESTFAGDVNIGGNLNVQGSLTGGTQVDLGQDLVVEGKLVVKGETYLGDDEVTDKLFIKGTTHIIANSDATKWDYDVNGAPVKDDGTGNFIPATPERVFSIVDKNLVPNDLFVVKENGDTIIGGVVSVKGSGTSEFAGNVSIGGNLNVQGTIGGTQVDLGEDLVVEGTLLVKGNTQLGDSASQDTTKIYGLTEVIANTDMSLWSYDDSGNPIKNDGAGNYVPTTPTPIFSIKDSAAGSKVFQVLENGDTEIAGVLKVTGQGISEFTGDVRIGGHLTVLEGATVEGIMSGSDFNITGNLIVDGNTTLGNDSTVDTTTIKGFTKIVSKVNKATGSSATAAFLVESLDSQPLFRVMENGDAHIAGMSYSSNSGTGSDGSTNFTGDVTVKSLLVEEDLTVKGITLIGDDATIDTTTIKGLTTVQSGVTKALGNGTNDAFRVIDADGADLFNVKTNGDTVIAGVLTVNGEGESSFAGDVNIGGSLTVKDGITSGTTMNLAEDLTVEGKLVVKGTTQLGDNVPSGDGSVDETLIYGKATIRTLGAKNAADASTTNVFEIIDSEETKLFEVRQNGDTIVGGSITVKDQATVQGVMEGNSLTLQGDLIVNGNTTLGNGPEDIVHVKTTLDMNNNTISNLKDPVNPQDAATKAYVDAARSGLDPKDSVKVATIDNINLTAGGVSLTIDGQNLIEGDRVLVRSQTNKAENGIYVVLADFTLERAQDADNQPDPGREVTAGMFTFVENGTYANAGFVLQVTGEVVLGTTPLNFVQFSGAGSFEAGDGLTKEGNTIKVVGTADRITVTEGAIDIANNYAGQNTITTVGEITTGTWKGTAIAVEHGGTGAVTASQARANLGATTKFAQDIGDGSTSIFAVNHGLETSDVTVTVREKATGEVVFTNVKVDNTNAVTLTFATAPGVNEYRVVIVG